MSDIKIWYINNDMLIQVSDLKNAADDSFINDAVVRATLRDDAGTEVGGIAWPLDLPYTGTPGLYQGTADKAAAIVDDAAYSLTITAQNPAGLEAEWTLPVGGEVRT